MPICGRHQNSNVYCQAGGSESVNIFLRQFSFTWRTRAIQMTMSTELDINPEVRPGQSYGHPKQPPYFKIRPHVTKKTRAAGERLTEGGA